MQAAASKPRFIQPRMVDKNAFIDRFNKTYASGSSRRRRPKLTRALLNGVEPSKSPNGPVYFQQLQLAAKHGLLPERTWEAIVASYRSQY
jgi:hypothetical protein